MLRLLAVVLLMASALGTGQPKQAAPSKPRLTRDGIVRLPPSAYPELPDSIRVWLEVEGYSVPQSFSDTGPHNVLHAEFQRSGQVDWAVLGSRRDTSEILIFSNASVGAVVRLAPDADQDYLQSVDQDSVAFSRLILVADPARIRALYAGEDTTRVPPIPIAHAGVEDCFCGKGSGINYWFKGKWWELPGGD